MTFFVIAFLLGDLYLQTLPTLLGKTSIIAFAIFTVLSFFYVPWVSLRYVVCAFCLGLLWTNWYAQNTLSWTLPKEWEGKSLRVTGIIASLPAKSQWQTQFLFAMKSIHNGNQHQKLHTLIRLSDRGNQSVRVGDTMQFRVRLKRIHGLQNPGTFDYEAWSLQKGLRASGYIIAHHKDNQFIAHHWYHFPIHQIRESIAAKMQAFIPKSSTSPWLLALTIGERQGISAHSWEILRNTGTNHLMAIAGLHIGLMSGFVHRLVDLSWRAIPRLMLYIPAQRAAAVAALSIGIIYSALAGFAVPTQRASLMLSIFILSFLWGRKQNVWFVWSFAMLMVLLLNPLSVLTESFWLSFGTIALIIYTMQGRLSTRGWWWKWGRVQWVIGLGLMPLTLFFFNECSLISFLANSIAIPWLGFFILPFCLLNVCFLFTLPKVSAWLLIIADKSLASLWWLLTWLSSFHYSTWHLSMPNMPIFIITIIGFIFLLLPKGVPGRWLGLFWLLPLITYTPPLPKHGEFWLSVLDVGQGLATVIETQSHILIYDAGPKYVGGADMGERVVAPFLNRLQVKTIDKLIISHGDMDHRGGAQFLFQHFKIIDVITSEPSKIFFANSRFCLSGQTWQWEGVTFKFLYPMKATLGLGNDSSCVLLIDNNKKRVLLTGDIEKIAERILLKTSSDEIKADVLIAPHHGSKTSALPAFVKTVDPTIVVYATGYRNRYHFPHATVVRSYSKALQLNTSVNGAIFLKFNQNDNHLLISLQRNQKHYWQDGI